MSMTEQGNPGDLGVAGEIAAAADRAVAAGALIADPIARAESYEDAMYNARALLAALKLGRQKALHEARARYSVEQIAQQMGVSRSRVYGILKGE